MSDYAKDVLVSPEWVEEHLDDFQSDDPAYRLVEVDVDTEAYDESHAPGAIGFNWETQLQDQTTRDILDKEEFASLMGSHGIDDDSTVVLYGDNSNWFAAYSPRCSRARRCRPSARPPRPPPPVPARRR